MKSSIKDFFSKCDQIRRKLQIWSHLLKKSLMGNFIFCVVIAPILFVQPPRISFFNSHCEKFVNLPLGKQSSFFQSIRYHWLCFLCPKIELLPIKFLTRSKVSRIVEKQLTFWKNVKNIVKTLTQGVWQSKIA